MGIGNDIKPKRPHQTTPHRPKAPTPQIEEEVVSIKHEEAPEVEVEKPKRHFDSFAVPDLIPVDEVEELDHLKNNFFDEDDHTFLDHKKKPHPADDKKQKAFNFFKKYLIWIFVLILAAVIIWQNFDTIAPKIDNEEKEATNTTDKYVITPAEETTETPTTTPAPAATPAPTTTPAVDNAAAKSALSLVVLNGNGIAGSADKISATLKAAGFLPSKTANAKNFNYTDTYIYYRTGKAAEAQLVKDALPNQSCILEESTTLAGKYEVTVVVGKK